jgi:uncharacterized protein (DUF2235 family)
VYKPSHLRSFVRWTWPLLDQAFGYYLSEQVEEGYKFLMEIYDSGDKICLFGLSRHTNLLGNNLLTAISFLGFSRGAYVARALAGMLHKVCPTPIHHHPSLDTNVSCKDWAIA